MGVGGGAKKKTRITPQTLPKRHKHKLIFGGIPSCCRLSASELCSVVLIIYK